MRGRRRRGTLVWLAAVVVAVAAAGGGYAWWQQAQEAAREQARVDAARTAVAYLDAWVHQSHEELRELVRQPPDDLVELHADLISSLRVERMSATIARTTLVDPEDPSAGARTPFTVELGLGSIGSVGWSGTLALERVAEDGWAVAWEPATLHPDLPDGGGFSRHVTWPDRAPIVGPDGGTLAGTGTQIDRMVGSVSDDGERPSGERGLQLAYDERLAGQPTVEVAITGPDGGVVEVLARQEGRAAEPLAVSLDPVIQRAAESAMPSSVELGAIVVLDAGTAAIRAVVNQPAGGFGRALSGRYPPGSTFKVVTTAAALRDGLAPADTVDCPATVTIGGRPFGNFEGQAFGEIPFREAFYRSCNTAFVQVAADLPGGALDEAAASFGFDAGWTLPIGEPVATFPEPGDLAERAAAAIGQAKVEASPVHMASVAAAVASGTWQPPTFLADVGDRPTADVGDVAPTLRELMAEVPARGTASGAGLPAGTLGKTGTAEYGTGDPLPTHAWFVGVADIAGGERIALAVLVEGGASGGSVAAPIAADLLERLAE